MRRLPLLLLLAVSGAPAAPPPLTGVVVDDRGPVAGAVVRVRATPLATRTDAAGRFTLPVGGAARVTAAAAGHLIAGADATAGRLTFNLPRVPNDDCESYAWVDPTPDPARPGNCGNCHAAAYREWAASGHARAASGSHFRNLYDGTDRLGRPNRGWNLLAELPAGAGVCAACHAPTAEPDAAHDYDVRRVTGVAAAGVHCDFCHKVGDVAAEPGLTHGRYGLHLSRPAAGQRFFGPLDDVDRGEDVFAPVQRDSRLCAACHEGT
ncbi:MAG TPA: carboxypeptidase-like regulatory domain-containing protein, partial [Gemmataceae bacterium]